MNSLENFKHLIQKIEYSEIKSELDVTLGWNAYIYDHRGVVEAGGTGKTKEIAIRIAYAELIERTTFLKIFKDQSLRDDFLIDRVPTTCGFAAGFSKSETKARSICEAIERWCWSQWIDKSKKIEKYNPLALDPLTDFFVKQFSSHDFYIKKIKTDGIPDLAVDDLYFCAFLGFKNDGVFLGSRVSNSFSDLFLHASIEAFRAEIIFNNLDYTKRKSDFYIDRIKYWGTHKRNIPNFDKFNDVDFDTPALSLSCEAVSSDEYFVYRALCENYIPWHIGDEKRFIY